MITCLGKSCSFGLLCVSFVNVYQFLCVCLSFPFGFEGGVWDLIVLIPDHCRSIYLSQRCSLTRTRFALILSIRLVAHMPVCRTLSNDFSDI